jgi:hypothetical protein
VAFTLAGMRSAAAATATSVRNVFVMVVLPAVVLTTTAN